MIPRSVIITFGGGISAARAASVIIDLPPLRATSSAVAMAVPTADHGAQVSRVLDFKTANGWVRRRIKMPVIDRQFGFFPENVRVGIGLTVDCREIDLKGSHVIFPVTRDGRVIRIVRSRK